MNQHTVAMNGSRFDGCKTRMYIRMILQNDHTRCQFFYELRDEFNRLEQSDDAGLLINFCTNLRACNAMTALVDSMDFERKVSLKESSPADRYGRPFCDVPPKNYHHFCYAVLRWVVDWYGCDPLFKVMFCEQRIFSRMLVHCKDLFFSDECRNICIARECILYFIKLTKLVLAPTSSFYDQGENNDDLVDIISALGDLAEKKCYKYNEFLKVARCIRDLHCEKEVHYVLYESVFTNHLNRVWRDYSIEYEYRRDSLHRKTPELNVPHLATTRRGYKSSVILLIDVADHFQALSLVETREEIQADDPEDDPPEATEQILDPVPDPVANQDPIPPSPTPGVSPVARSPPVNLNPVRTSDSPNTSPSRVATNLDLKPQSKRKKAPRPSFVVSNKRVGTIQQEPNSENHLAGAKDENGQNQHTNSIISVAKTAVSAIRGGVMTRAKKKYSENNSDHQCSKKIPVVSPLKMPHRRDYDSTL